MPHETNAADDNPPPLPSPPFITVDGIANFRDAGGYAILPSVTNNSITPSPSPSSTPQSIRPHPNAPASIRPHYLYRSADPSRITPSGKTTIQNLGITHLFDLRSAPEIEKQKASGQPVQTIEGVERRETPAFATQDYSPQAIAGRYRDYASGEFEGFTRAYADILSHAHAAFRTILLHIRDHPSQPLVIHCSAGKDRTGIIVALILSLAGASDETIADEYALTELGLGALREVIIRHLLESPALGGERGKAVGMVGAKKEYMLSSLQMIRENYGGAEGYVKECCGLSEEDVQTIRMNMVVDEPPIV